MNAVAQQKMAEKIAEDLCKAVDAWLVPELEKILGHKVVIGISNQDFDSILMTQYKGLWLDRSHTIKDDCCLYYFRLMQRDISKGKSELISKFTWTLVPEDYETEEIGNA